MRLISAPLRSVTPSHQHHSAHPHLAPAVPSEPGDSGNLLLATLPTADWQRWSPCLELVDMPRGLVLYEAGRSFSHVHFPTSSIVSLHTLMSDGACVEVAVVGNDGVVGVPLLLGGGLTNGRAVVHGAGQGYRLDGQALVDEFSQGGALTHLLLHYTQALLTQIALTAACNRHHSIDQQVCRLILLSLDRVQGNLLQMTQEMLAGRLGVRRESVTAVALALKRDGLIHYARGCIEVLDRAGLEDRVCECYAVVKLESDRLLCRTDHCPEDRWTLLPQGIAVRTSLADRPEKWLI